MIDLSKITISNANICHIDSIAKLFVQNVDKTYITSGEQYYLRASLDKGWNKNIYENIFSEITEIVNNNLKTIFVMHYEQNIIGYILIGNQYNKCAELEDFVLDKDFRSKGLGQKLYETAIEYCKNNNINILFLEVGLHNKKMQKFCENNDIKPISIKYYKNI